MRKSLMIAAAVAALCVPASALAQQQPMQPQRIENVSWHMVEFVKFNPGKRERAMEIIENYFAPADSGAGQVIDLHFDTGEWDAIVVFPMSGGPSDLTWATSPEEIKWMNAMAAKAGGVEQARALLAEWDTLVAHSEQHVAHRHPDW